MSATTPTPTPARSRAARGSYLDQLLAEPTETSSREVPAPPATPEPDPQWQSWWDTTQALPTAATVPGPSTAVSAAPEPTGAEPGRAPRFGGRRTTPTRRARARIPVGQRSRLPGRGVHVPRRGPAWSCAMAGRQS